MRAGAIALAVTLAVAVTSSSARAQLLTQSPARSWFLTHAVGIPQEAPRAFWMRRFYRGDLEPTRWATWASLDGSYRPPLFTKIASGFAPDLAPPVARGFDLSHLRFHFTEELALSMRIGFPNLGLGLWVRL